jgi:hypothetical protein
LTQRLTAHRPFNLVGVVTAALKTKTATTEFVLDVILFRKFHCRVRDTQID